MTTPTGGDATILIRADGRGLRRDVDREITAAERGQQIDVPVVPNVRSPRWRDLRGRLRDERGRFVAEGDAMGGQAGDAIADSLSRRLNLGLGALGRALGSALRVTTLVGGFAVLSASAAVAAGSLIQLAAAIAPAAGALAAVPGGIALFAAALQTLNVALGGTAEAFKAAAGGDAAKLEEALKDLAPSAQEAVRAFAELRPAFLDLRTAVQGEFFTGFADAITSTANVLLGPLTQGMTQVAGEMNQLALGFAGLAASADSVGLIENTFSTLSDILGSLREPLLALGAAMIDLAGVGVSAIGGLSTGFGDIVTRIAEFIQAAVDSGQALNWITGALDVLSQLGSLLASVGGIIVSIGQAAGQAGGDILGTFTLLLDSVNSFLNTGQGQEFLLNLFTALGDIGAALSPVLTALGTQLSGILPIIGQIATALGPGLEALITGLGGGLAALGPSLVPLAGAISGLVTAMSPVLVIVGQLAGALASGLAPILTSVATGITSILTAAQPTFDTLLPLFGEFALILGETLAPVFETLGTVIAQLLPPISELALMLIDQMLPVWQQFSVQLGELMPLIGELIVALANALLPIIEALLPPFLEFQQAIGGLLIESLITLIPLITFLVEVITPLLTIVAGLAGILLNNLVGAIQVVVGWISNFISWLGDLWAAGDQTRSRIVGAVIGMAQGIGDAFNSIKGWIDDVVQWFIDLPGRVLSAISGLGSSIWSSITGGLGDLGSVLGLADGDIITRPTLAVMGERYKPEVVIPLTKPARAMQLAEQSGLLRLIDSQRGTPGRSGDVPSIEQHIHSTSVSPQVIADHVRRELAVILRSRYAARLPRHRRRGDPEHRPCRRVWCAAVGLRDHL